MRCAMTIHEKASKVLERAKALASQVESWADLSNALFDRDEGIVPMTFPDSMERQAFFDSQEYEEINSILAALMKKFGVVGGGTPQKSGKFIVRIPKTLHDVLDIEAKAEGVSLNQLIVAKVAFPLREKVDLATQRLVRAYSAVYDGYSSDRVVLDPLLNSKFLKECRNLGLSASDYLLNHRLYDIRKSKKAKLPKATKRTEFRDFDDYRFASEIAVRILQRIEGVTLDRIMCDPELRVRFDGYAQQLADESNVLKLRWAALNLRKTHMLQPTDLSGPQYDPVSAGPIKTIDLDRLPELGATYVFYDHNRPIYAGETANLRVRIERHLGHGLPSWVGEPSELELSYFVETSPNQAERLRWLRWFINQEKPLLNYQRAA